LCYFLAISLQPLVAQHNSLSGFVIDKQTKQPISNVVVKLAGYNTYTTTNNDGSLKFIILIFQMLQ